MGHCRWTWVVGPNLRENIRSKTLHSTWIASSMAVWDEQRIPFSLSKRTRACMQANKWSYFLVYVSVLYWVKKKLYLHTLSPSHHCFNCKVRDFPEQKHVILKLETWKHLACSKTQIYTYTFRFDTNEKRTS